MGRISVQKNTKTAGILNSSCPGWSYLQPERCVQACCLPSCSPAVTPHHQCTCQAVTSGHTHLCAHISPSLWQWSESTCIMYLWVSYERLYSWSVSFFSLWSPFSLKKKLSGNVLYVFLFSLRLLVMSICLIKMIITVYMRSSVSSD